MKRRAHILINKKKALESLTLCQGGFTLLEVLASIFLFALITLAISSTIRSTSRLTGLIKSRETTTLSASIAMDRMQRELQLAYNEKLQHSPSLFQATETADGFTLKFSFIESEMRTLIDRRAPGFLIATYTLRREEKGLGTLLRSEQPMVNTELPLPSPAPEILARGVLDWKMEFYDLRSDKWNPTWDSLGPINNSVFPTAIRLSIETVDPSLKSDQQKDRSLKMATEFLVFNELEQK